MTWLRVDDRICDDPATLDLGDLLLGCAVRLAAWCARHNTDGKLTAAAVKMIATPEKTKKLLSTGWLVKEADGYALAIGLIHIRPRAEVEAERAASAERQARIRRARSDRRMEQGTFEKSNGVTHGVTPAEVTPVVTPTGNAVTHGSPVPSRPVPSLGSGDLGSGSLPEESSTPPTPSPPSTVRLAEGWGEGWGWEPKIPGTAAAGGAALTSAAPAAPTAPAPATKPKKPRQRKAKAPEPEQAVLVDPWDFSKIFRAYPKARRKGPEPGYAKLRESIHNQTEYEDALTAAWDLTEQVRTGVIEEERFVPGFQNFCAGGWRSYVPDAETKRRHMVTLRRRWECEISYAESVRRTEEALARGEDDPGLVESMERMIKEMGPWKAPENQLWQEYIDRGEEPPEWEELKRIVAEREAAKAAAAEPGTNAVASVAR